MSKVWDLKVDFKPSVTAVKRLFAQTDWADERDYDSIAKMIQNTSLCLTVYDGDSLVGFARVITGFVYRAFIEIVIEDNSYKGLGIGASIVRTFIARLGEVDEVCHL